MRIYESLLIPVACGALFVSGFAGPVLPLVAQQGSSATREQAESATPVGIHDPEINVSGLPDSPEASLTQAQALTFPQAAPSQTAPNQIPPDQAATNPASPQRPVGTAAAEAPNASGIAASEPAGVAIAPAKQRRARTIIIRTGAIIGAAVALGAVVALTEATSSKPPGAH